MLVSEAFKSESMKSMLGDLVLEHELSRIRYDQPKKTPMKLLPGPDSSHVRGSLGLKQGRTATILSIMNKLVKNKLGVEARQVGGVEKLFGQIFNLLLQLKRRTTIIEGFSALFSTTAGPLQGRLFISIDRLTFCNDRPISKCQSSTGELLRFYYEVMIPLNKIKGAGKSKNFEKASQKYLQVMTTDDFKFWFMGFLNYGRTFKSLQQAVSKSLI